MFSPPQEALRTRWCDDRGDQQALQDGRQIETAIETILDLSEIAVSIFGKVEGMVGSRVGGLQVAEESIDRTELLQLGAVWTAPAPGHGTLVHRPRGGDRLETPQAIRYHPRRGDQRRLRPLSNRFLGEFQLLQANPQRASRLRRLYGGDERYLVLRTASALTARQFTT